MIKHFFCKIINSEYNLEKVCTSNSLPVTFCGLLCKLSINCPSASLLWNQRLHSAKHTNNNSSHGDANCLLQQYEPTCYLCMQTLPHHV